MSHQAKRELSALELEQVSGGITCGYGGYHVSGMATVGTGIEVAGLTGPGGLASGCFYPNLGGTGTSIIDSDFPSAGGGYVDGP